jgi:phosphoacetylglucosamine mutase
MQAVQLAALAEASARFPPAEGFRPAYGTAGFRAAAHLLPATIFRCGVLMALRALRARAAVGICVTASHNPAPDNGVKLVDPSGEMLDQRYEADVDALARAPSDAALAALVAALAAREGVSVSGGGGGGAALLIAHDTRPSGPGLAAAAAAGAAALGVPATLLGTLTTPQLHWAVMRTNRGEDASEEAYYATFSAAYAALAALGGPPGGPPPPAESVYYVDCANGVGARSLAALAPRLARAGLRLELRNTGAGVLNGGCGSDWVQGARALPPGFAAAPPGARCAAFDGDADRVLFFSPAAAPAAPPLLLDGDRITALVAALLGPLLAALPAGAGAAGGAPRLGVVQTAYANGASTAYLRALPGVALALAPTGVKHLHHAARAFDVGVYWEANGHGTALFAPAFLERLRALAADPATGPAAAAAAELLAVEAAINAAVGDAASGLLLAEAALRRLGWGFPEWGALYADLPSRQAKVRVADRAAIETADAETRCVAPAGLQAAVDAAAAKVKSGRAFVRPSGTEDVVRVYAEAASAAEAEALTAEVAAAVHALASGVGAPPA